MAMIPGDYDITVWPGHYQSTTDQITLQHSPIIPIKICKAPAPPGVTCTHQRVPSGYQILTTVDNHKKKKEPKHAGSGTGHCIQMKWRQMTAVQPCQWRPIWRELLWYYFASLVQQLVAMNPPPSCLDCSLRAHQVAKEPWETQTTSPGEGNGFMEYSAT